MSFISEQLFSSILGATFLFKQETMKKVQKTENLNFTEAMEAIEAGHKVKLPEWTGHWYKGQSQVEVFTKTGERLTTPDMAAHGHRNDWLVTDGKLGFDFAILALKNGKLVRRTGWNGKGMFVFMRPADSLNVDFIIEKVKSLPQDVKDYFSTSEVIKREDEVDFTAYFCMKSADGTIINGWIPTTTDLSQTDWELAE